MLSFRNYLPYDKKSFLQAYGENRNFFDGIYKEKSKGDC